MTPSTSSSQRETPIQKTIRKGLQSAVMEYLQAPPASTLPRLEFLTAGPLQSSSSIRLEESMRQMSRVISAMSETVLSDQESQESLAKNTWKALKKGKTTTSNYPWTEYWFNREVCFGHPDVSTL